MPGSYTSIWREKAGSIQFCSSLLPLKCIFGWDRCLHLALCYLARMGMHRHLEGFDCNWGIWWWGIKSDPALLLHKKAYTARKICWRTRREDYQLALALVFEGLITQIFWNFNGKCACDRTYRHWIKELLDLNYNFLHISPWPISEAGSGMPLYLITCSDTAL